MIFKSDIQGIYVIVLKNAIQLLYEDIIKNERKKVCNLLAKLNDAKCV